MTCQTLASTQRAVLTTLGALLLGAAMLPAHAYTVTVTDTAGLRAALYAISSASDATNNGDVDNTITFGNSITLSSELWAINLPVSHNLTINGNGFALDGANQHRGFFVNRGRVTISRLAIRNAVARGGLGRKGGGGGAGLGGGLFVRAAAAAILDRVDFVSNDAIGGGSVGGVFLGGGGGLGGDGGDTASGSCGGGGGIGRSATGGGGAAPRGAGIIPGDNTAGNTRGGGGAGTGPSCGSSGSRGGTQLFGGGGGGSRGNGIDGSFGGGGGGGEGGVPGGNGGFGGGAGGGQGTCCRTAGFGGGGATYGAGDVNGAAGGGGLGAGGAIFVQQGGELVFRSGSIDGGTAVAGVPTGPQGPFNTGRGYGSGLFIEGTGSALFEPAAGETITISDTIADMRGSEPSRPLAALLRKRGAGTLVFGDANLIGGRLAIEDGVLEVSANNQLGSLSAPIELSNAAVLRIAGTGLSTTTRTFALLDGGGAFDIASAGHSFTLTNALTGSTVLRKRGPGTVVIGTGNGFTGETIVEAGALLVNGELSPAASVTVRSGAALSGSGRVGDAVIESGGAIRLNVAATALRANRLTVAADGGIVAQLGSSAAGRIEVADTVSIDDTLFEIITSAYNGPLRTFTVIDNRGGGPIIGSFAGLGEGAEIVSTGSVFRISYQGGDGNDLVLTELDVRFRDGFETTP